MVGYVVPFTPRHCLYYMPVLPYIVNIQTTHEGRYQNLKDVRSAGYSIIGHDLWDVKVIH